jgi:hypothetical protein
MSKDLIERLRCYCFDHSDDDITLDAADRIEALEAELARYKVGNEHLENALTCAEEELKAQAQEPVVWRPIETAPKDGTEFIAAFGHQGFVMMLFSYNTIHGYWQTKGIPNQGFLENATHWTPLPAKPGTAPPPSAEGWLRAVDDAMVCSHLGVANASDDYATAKKKLNDLICWSIDVAKYFAEDAKLKQLVDALSDMRSGWIYIRQTYGDLYGVGWDRALEKADAALLAARGEGK